MAWRCGQFQPQSHAAVERLPSNVHGGNAARFQVRGGDQLGFIIASIDSAKAFPMSANVFAHPR